MSLVERLRTECDDLMEDGIEQPALTMTEAADEIETLRRQLAEKDAEIEKLKRRKNVGLADDSSDREPKQQRHLACPLEMGQLLERGADKEAGDSEAEGVFLVDHFQGNDTQLVASMRDLVHLDSKGCLFPHGIGGHARLLISSSVIRIQAANKQLAESQAREVKLREALVDLRDEFTRTREWGCLPVVLLKVAAILAMPQDNTALEAYVEKAKSEQSNFDNQQFIAESKRLVEKAGECMREWCRQSVKDHVENRDDRHFTLGVIRALPGVTLEDLQK